MTAKKTMREPPQAIPISASGWATAGIIFSAFVIGIFFYFYTYYPAIKKMIQSYLAIVVLALAVIGAIVWIIIKTKQKDKK